MRNIEDYQKIYPRPGRLEGGLRISRNYHNTSAPDRSLVTIITVVFNGKKYLEQTIQSVLNQTYNNIEYIIIDGDSTDETLDIIRRYEDRIAYWISEPDRGIYDAMNKGIAASTGVLINLLNADDYLEPGAVEQVVQTYRKAQKPVIVYGHAHAVDDRHAVKAKMFSSPAYWLGMTINHQTMFVHREVYKAIGLYNLDDYRLAADYDFLLRCYFRQIDFRMIPEFVVNFRNSGVSARGKRYRKEANVINKNYFGTTSWKRIAFLVFNYSWMPFKLTIRTALYKTLGVRTSRRLIEIYKNVIHPGRG
jgi:glycosyltransferase involved in cell wall biosynthesis